MVSSRVSNNKQLLIKVEHDFDNYQGRGLFYPLMPKAEVDNTNRSLDNSRYHAKTERNNCCNYTTLITSAAKITRQLPNMVNYQRRFDQSQTRIKFKNINNSC